jgi:hypothetical protein
MPSTATLRILTITDLPAFEMIAPPLARIDA